MASDRPRFAWARDDLGFEAPYVLATILLGIVLGIAVVLLSVRQVGHHVDHSKCDQYEAQTGRPAKFVDWNFADWDCLTQLPNGQWVPIDTVGVVPVGETDG